VQVFRICCRPAEAAVEVTDECLKPGIRVINAGNVLEPHLLNKPIMKRKIGAFDAAFSLRAVGTDKVDVQVVQSASELCHAGTACFCLRWYNEERIKISLGAMSPVKYRQHLRIST